MTMIAMWLDEESVALATDSRMSNTDGSYAEVRKLHRLPSGKAMFGVGFDTDEIFYWLCNCPCTSRHPYPEHWCDCSQAQSVSQLEQIIKGDLKAGDFPSKGNLELWMAGISAQGTLEAFLLDRSGRRTIELTPGHPLFNTTSQWMTERGMLPLREQQIVATGLGLEAKGLWQPEKRFWALKEQFEGEKSELPGARALKETCQQLIDFCKEHERSPIGGKLQFEVICAVP